MLIIGLMSGTSADGVDIALCDISGQPSSVVKAKIITGTTMPYDDVLRQRILDSCDRQKSRVDEIAQLNVDIAELFSQAILDFLQDEQIDLAEIDLIASHGQTLWHNVLDNGDVSATFQIGEASVIAERTGITTIHNFRARDVATGGQGAPLTGYADWLLLRHPTQWRAIQNIGGMGNVTFLPPIESANVSPVAFDTGPGNALIDATVYYHSDGQQTYDKDGQLAKQGRIDEVWLDDLLQHPYYQRAYPKTTGRELFGTEMALALIQDAEQKGISIPDQVATLTALTATTIAEAYRALAPAKISEVILGGGGYRNPVIVDLLQSLLHPSRVLTHEDIGIDSDYKEALVFALLAHETWHGRPSTLPSLTGATKATILGQITPSDNFEDLLLKRLSSER